MFVRNGLYLGADFGLRGQNTVAHVVNVIGLARKIVPEQGNWIAPFLQARAAPNQGFAYPRGHIVPYAFFQPAQQTLQVGLPRPIDRIEMQLARTVLVHERILYVLVGTGVADVKELLHGKIGVHGDAAVLSQSPQLGAHFAKIMRSAYLPFPQ